MVCRLLVVSCHISNGCLFHCFLPHFQVYRNLRTYGTLSRNDIQCMMFTGNEGLPETIRRGLNSKVDQLLKVCCECVLVMNCTCTILFAAFYKICVIIVNLV